MPSTGPHVKVARFGLGRLGGALDAAGLAPTIARDVAWKATIGGLVTYVAWQAAVAGAAALAYIDRTRGAGCRLGPLCGRVDAWGDGTLAFMALLVLTGSLAVIVAVGRIGLGLWRGRFWAGIATRLAGIGTAVGGLVLVFVGGLPWLALGLWLAFWAKRLRYEPPAWATPPEEPGRPPDPMVLEAERV